MAGDPWPAPWFRWQYLWGGATPFHSTAPLYTKIVTFAPVADESEATQSDVAARSQDNPVGA